MAVRSVWRRSTSRSALRGWLTGLLLSLASAPVLAPTPAAAADPSQVGEWGPGMNFGAEAIHAVLMHTGNVLMWSRASADARVWDPATGEIKLTPFTGPTNNIECAGQVVLADGRVFQIGGLHISATATFDPQTMKWTPMASMGYVRWYPTATMLSDGRVLAANGEDSNDLPVTALEVYDPATNQWTVLQGADRQQAVYANNFLLPNGQVYEATPKISTALLDLSTDTWASGPDSDWQTSSDTESAAMYLPGKIIRAGGTPIRPINLATSQQAHNRTEIVDMTALSPAWQETSPMAFERRRLNMVILADGQVMAVGGTRQSDDPSQAVLAGEIWNPDTKQWTTVASMTYPRMYHSTALLLPDGRVLSAGGAYQTVGLETASTAQIYSPSYLFKGPRPGIGTAPGNVSYGSAFSISTPDAATIASVALIRPAATTHGNDMDQRYVPLGIQSRISGGLTVNAPANGNWAPPGWYMLVIKNSNGVPSVAKWVQVSAKPTSPLEPGPSLAPAPGPTLGSAGGPAPLGGPTTAAVPSGSSGAIPGTATRNRLVSVTMRRRIRLREVRRRGLVMDVGVAVWVDPGSRVMRIRVFRLFRGGQRRLVATVFRHLRYPESFRLILHSPAVRRALRPGRYQLEVAGGTSRSALEAPERHRFTVVG